ncbi:MOSC domain protein [Roseivivax sp. THAF40]|uniref:MOSC domain-containing protein n=1 Tax=unclassified Roseivivax TaxID=2639302 RepID=UPI001267AA15|nr:MULTISPECIES: MOSC N-terminal beta barrel domain-containing protein [unclassified Roseivivax]QFS81534.1 MOSC domain protein [Roseivivax sp. THAF197b]QFT45263.1 MOSC domain protein [Roseivivax sp. THAF40]
MTGHVTSLWRHPIKSLGRDALEAVSLSEGRTVPWDRHWAIAHEAAAVDGSTWAPCMNFSRVAQSPGMMAVTASFDDETGTITLNHPELPTLTADPDAEGDAIVAWMAPLVPENRPRPSRLVRAEHPGWTDSDFPSVTLCNTVSHRAVEQRLGQPLSIHRWRGNIWIDGLAPWEEFDWMDQKIRIGEAVLQVRERTDRCRATTANPDTGRIDADTLGALDHWDHRDFSVRAEVIEGGRIALGAEVEVLR